MEEYEKVLALLRSPRGDAGQARVLAVVGLSPNPERPSFGVAARLQRAGLKIVPVNPGAQEILGERCYPTLGTVPGDIDCVQVFRKSDDVPPVVDEAIEKGVKAIWMQTGIENAEAALKARRSGILVVMNRCLATDWVLR
ncbi:MAG: CoA-binding protein [Deltaproteobacteria bacterium]|nr:CoA-binding protein [Deltaproteobacteria bacterium]